MPTERIRDTEESKEEREEQSRMRAARIAIGIQFLIIIVTLADCLRLEYSSPIPLPLAKVDPYIIGALIAAVCTSASVALYFFKEYRFTTLVGGGTVVLLFAYKLWAIGL
jgi:hypothetical protein